MTLDVPTCPFCGEPEELSLFEIWEDGNFQLSTCCVWLLEHISAEIDADPRWGRDLLRHLGAEDLTGHRLRRVPSHIEQREGRIERQGNQNEEIGVYAYATLGSTDATMWQNNERKQRFINAALSGDRSIRRIEDAGSQVSQFAMAKAIASGDPRLMQKAGLEAEIARLQRQEAAHFDDQHAVRSQMAAARRGKGAAMIGDFRTDALHQALREKPIDDDQLIAMLVLALAGNNVTVLSGVVGRHRVSRLGQVAEALTEGGVLTRDLDAIRHAARETLVEVLSCRENHSASGMGARHAGSAIDADAYLPNMATAEFLPALSRSALEGCAAGHSIRVWPRVKDTREALATHFRNGTFILPAARFAPTEAELEARRNPAGIVADIGKDDDRQPEDEDVDIVSAEDEVTDQDDDEAGQGDAEADTGIVRLVPPAALPVQAAA